MLPVVAAVGVALLAATSYWVVRRKKVSLGQLFFNIANNINNARNGVDILYEVRPP